MDNQSCVGTCGMAFSDKRVLPFEKHIWSVWPHCSSGCDTRGDGCWELLQGPFHVGELVAINLKSNTKHCQAVILQSEGNNKAADQFRTFSGQLYVDELRRPLIQRRTGRHAAITHRSYDHFFPGQYGFESDVSQNVSLQTVRLVDDRSIVSVPSHRLIRVLSRKTPRVLITADTACYRRLAKTQLGRNDAVLEIGSSLGECTHLLHCHAGAVIGVDVVKDLVNESRQRHPQCRFEWLDCFEEPDRLLMVIKELHRIGDLKVFVDIGGDRSSVDVCCMLATLQEAINNVMKVSGTECSSSSHLPALVVVKSRAMAASAAAWSTPDGFVANLATWFKEASALPPPGSFRQMKKKIARARKAKWNSADPQAWKTFHDYRKKWEESEQYDRLISDAREMKLNNISAWGDKLRSFIEKESLSTSA